MDWKEFLKPTKNKIIVFFVIYGLGIAFTALYNNVAFAETIRYLSMFILRIIYFPSMTLPINFYGSLHILKLFNVIYQYLIASLIVYLWNKRKGGM